MKVKQVLSILLGICVCACASSNPDLSSSSNEAGVTGSCDPGVVMEGLAEDMNIGLSGAEAEKIAGMYDAFFKVMRTCGKAGNLEFSVKLEWADQWAGWITGFPPLPPFAYLQRVSRAGGLCLSRKGMESKLAMAPEWYCERTGWVDKI